MPDLLAELLQASHTMPPDRLAPTVARLAEIAGFTDLEILLIDHEQVALLQLGGPEEYDVEGTLAGRAYRRTEPVEAPAEHGCTRMYHPMLDGAERVGVLGVTVTTREQRELVPALASLVSLLIVSKSAFGDVIARRRRRQPMTLAAELRWSVLPPLTFTGRSVTIAGVLEPPYRVAGDAFDYGVDTALVHLAIFDGMGHGLESARLANLALAAFRHARRSGAPLLETYEAIDGAIADQFHGEMFITGQIARLGFDDGRLQVLNAGHPAPMVLRDNRYVGDMACPPWHPFGLGLPRPGDATEVAETMLEPGDRVLFLTDGMIEARSATGEDFGRERLADFLVRAAADMVTLPETMRRLARAVLAHQGGQLQDDATLLLVEWSGPPD